MSDSSVLLAKSWETKIDPTNWWMSEKLDGVRAVWTGKKLVTRNDKPIPAPEWFLAFLPKYMPLDGELWAGRGNFQDAVSIVRCGSQDKGWAKIVYMIFDIPDPKAGPFEARQEALAAWLRADKPNFKLVPQQRCHNPKHLGTEMDRVIAGKGEGIMLRQPGSNYEKKRSSTLLKVKRFYDTEARVTGHVPGKGKHEGRLGALECKLADGTEFEVGTGFTDAERERPPRIGSKITVRYQELSRSGTPRFPVYVTERDYE